MTLVALVGLAFAAFIFYVTSALALGWRIGLPVLVAAPLLLLVDLLRAEPGASPRRQRPRSPRGD